MPRTVSDPKVRQVGFFAPPDRSQSVPPAPTSSFPLVSEISPSGNSLSPVMIPPPRNVSSDMSRHFPPAPISPLRGGRGAADSSIPVGSYNPSEFISPTATADFSEDALSPGWGRKGNSAKIASSLPTGGIDMVKQNNVPASGLTMVSNVRTPKAVKGSFSFLPFCFDFNLGFLFRRMLVFREGKSVNGGSADRAAARGFEGIEEEDNES